MNLNNKRDLTIWLNQQARKRRKTLSIPEQVRSILNKYNATMLLPGVAEPILGPELAVNGDFSNGAAGWSSASTAPASWTVTGGQLVMTSDGTNRARARQTIATVVGTSYQVTAQLTNAEVELGTSAGGIQYVDGGQTTGPFRHTFTATSTSLFVQLSSVFNGTSFGDNISVREILGYNHTRYSYQAGNYRESTGQTLAAADQQVGLVVDAAGTVGPELVTTNWIFSQPTSGSVSFQDGTLRVNSIDGSFCYGQQTILEVNKFYALDIAATVVSGSVVVGDGGSSTYLAVSTSGAKKTAVFKATTSVLQIKRQAACDVSLTNISVRELPGIHASQSTSGFQPVLRRGLVNQLLWSSDFSNAAWSRIGCSYAGGRLFEDTLNQGRNTRQAYTLVTGSKYSVAARVKPDQREIVYLASYDGVRDYGVSFNIATGQFSGIRTSANAVAPSGYSISPDKDGYFIIVMNFTSQGVGGVFAAQVGLLLNSGNWPSNSYQGDGASGIYLHSAALFQDTVTADQIIAAGGIPVTTTAPASSANGVQSWQFDGTDDRLSLSAVPFQMADDHFVVVGAQPSALLNRDVFALANDSQTAPLVAMLRFELNSSISAFWRLDSNGGRTITLPTSCYAAGESLVLAARRQGTNGLFRKNGGQFSLSANDLPIGAATINTATVGGALRGGSSTYFNGHIHGVIFGKGAISDSELLTLERFMAQLQGRQL